ncbi:hypothetical protein ABT063_50395, partial [Streptomyces sp. NPDC002838]|uniref:hypothetical protein n=1 Tax=Streptomyces sp. NPDC002838 TaxID=3154436 RepID=UPI003318EDAB
MVTFDEMWHLDWGHDWTSIVEIPQRLPDLDTMFVLSYKNGEGRAHLNTFAEDGAMNPVWQRDDWGTGWTSIVPISVRTEQEAAILLLSYQGGTGKAHLNTVEPDGAMNPVWQRDDWGTGWTSIVPIQIWRGGMPTTLLLSYQGGTGKAHLNTVEPDGAMNPVWQRDDW